MAEYIPCMESVSVVPVGLTKYRDGLFPLRTFNAREAGETIDLIEKWQKKLYAAHQTHFIHASDEFYILAGRPLPEEERYDGYPQLENGVGMLRLLTGEVEEALENLAEEDRDVEEMEVSIATGKLAYPFLQTYIQQIEERFPARKVHLYAIRNDFFGEEITVAGLITGQDIIAQLKGKNLGSCLLLPSCMFRSGEEVFLDDVTRTEVESSLQVPVHIVKSGGYDLVDAILHPEHEKEPPVYAGYEPERIFEHRPGQYFSEEGD